MAVLWSAGEPLPVRAVLDRLNEGRRSPLAYTTVMTVLTRLADKAVLVRRQVGRRYLYEPVADDPAGLAVREVLRDFGELAVARFVDEAQADPALRRRLRALTRNRRADRSG